LTLIGDVLARHDIVVFFNAKHDLHWLRRYGIRLPEATRIWCCQLAHFVFSRQQDRYPSLNLVCEKYGLGKKLDVVKTQYWDLGIDTDAVPWDILRDYANQDVELTYQVYLKQQECLKQKQHFAKLLSLSNQDTLVLAEIEWNGLPFDEAAASAKATELEAKLDAIDNSLRESIGEHPINFNSVDHLSCILYGGTIRFKHATAYDHTYKSGPKAGLTEARYKHFQSEVKFPRLVEPINGSELVKDGYWSTDEATLKRVSAKGASTKVIQQVLERSKLERLVSTYLRGFPKKRLEMDWREGTLHSQMNQCVAVTGRLSSSGPNQQNLPPEAYALVNSRCS